jgi:hypothetical protein
VQPFSPVIRGFGTATAIVVLAFASGCANYKQVNDATRTIDAVHVTAKAADVADCRFLEKVDYRDTAKGCGLTVNPTPEECLRYQVRLVGGDTLLRDGPVGKAYVCSSQAEVANAEPTTPASPEPAPNPAPVPAASVASAASAPTPPASPSAPPTPSVSAAQPPSGVRLTFDRDEAKGCVYLGDFAPGTACEGPDGQLSPDCADRAKKAGGDLVLVQDVRAQIFSCKARPQ